MRTIVAIALILASAGVARADDEEAARYFAAGNQAYQAGEYLLAATAYEEAYKLTPLPAIVFTMAQAYRRHYYVDPQVRWLRRAQELYRQYLDEVPRGGRRAHAVTHLATIDGILRDADPEDTPEERPPPAATQLMVTAAAPGARASIDGGELVAVPMVHDVVAGEHRVRVEAPGHDPAEATWLAVAERLVVAQVEPAPRPAELVLRTPDGARIAVDGRPLDSGGRVELPAGSHAVTVTLRGHRSFARRIELDHGEVLALDASLPPTRQRVASYWVLGGAGAVLVAGGVTTVLALVAQDDATAIRGRLSAFGGDQTTWSDEERAEFNDAVARRDDLRVTSYLLAGGAVALAATGVLLYTLDTPGVESPPAPDPAVRPVVGPDTIGAAWSGSF